MPHYFFDTFENGHHVQDDVGLPCGSIADVRWEAMRGLSAIAMEQIPKRFGEQTFSMHVRDEKGCSVYSATLRFDGSETDGIGAEDTAADAIHPFS